MHWRRSVDSGGDLSYRLSSDRGQPQLAARRVLSFLVYVSLVWFHPPEPAFSQAEKSVWDSVPGESAGLSDDFLNLEFDAAIPDSLRLQASVIEIQQARLQATQSNLWHRLVPEIHISASLGFKDALFLDASNSVLSVLPKDAYRISLSLSVNDIFDFSKNAEAELRLKRTQLDSARMYQQQEESRSKVMRERDAIKGLITLLSEELNMKQEVLKFNELRFQQGKIEYDAFIRSKLDVLNVEKTIYRLNQQYTSNRPAGH